VTDHDMGHDMEHDLKHDTIQPMLALYAADALDPGERRRVDQHAGTCEICRRELLAWGAYAGGLTQLPQPIAHQGLMERTRLRIVQQREAAAARRRENAMLAALVVLGWAVSLATWTLMRALVGGSLVVLGANLVSGVNWFLLSTVLAWTTAAAAATMLGKRVRRVYGPVS
jgi:anti-sigma factor RsiW